MSDRLVRAFLANGALLSLLAWPVLAGQPTAAAEAGRAAPAKIAGEAPPRGNLHVAPIQSRPHGRSYAEWIAEWWRWILETPAEENPLRDTDGEHCATGQRGRVWFLAGALSGDPVERSCTVPPGTALFFPIANGVWASTPEAPGCGISADPWYLAGPDDPEWAEFEEAVLNNPDQVWPPSDAHVLTLSVDGRPARRLGGYYAVSEIFSAVLPEGNLFGCEELNDVLTSPDVGWGYHVFLNPLPPGEHTLRFTASGPNIDQDVTYHLTVEHR